MRGLGFIVSHAVLEPPHSPRSIAYILVHIAMANRRRYIGNPEPREQIPLDELGEEARSETRERPNARRSPGEMDNSSGGSALSGAPSEYEDFDDGANALWSLYGKEAQIHDKARFESLAADMNGVPTFAGLFAAVLTSFLVQSIQNLQVNPAQESAYYSKQSVAMLAQISQQIASITPQVSIPPPPPPYSATPSSSSDIRVNICWLIGLVCSLSAALFAILVQHWVRSYMQVFQRYDHPLKRARFRQFYFEGAKRIQLMADTVPILMHFSLFLFFGGLGDFMLSFDRTVGVATIVPAYACGVFYLSDALARLIDPRSPNHSPILRRVLIWVQNFPRGYFNSRRLSSMSLEAYRERLVMSESKGRKSRDVRALQWLVNNTAVKADVEPLALAIPGSFNTEWGREVWRDVSSQGGSHADMSGHSPASSRVSLSPISQHSLEEAAVNTVSQCVRYLFETCNNHNHFESDDARRRRMRACVDAAASLVCYIDFRLEWFGEVSKLISDIGYMEKISEPPTGGSDQSFTVRWTCLSLMAAQQTLRSNPLQVQAQCAVSGLARIQPDVGEADEMAPKTAQWIDEHLKIAWECAGDLHRAFEPWSQTRTREQVEEILRNHESQISALEIKTDATEFDERVSLLQDRMDETSHRLIRQLPSISFSELKYSGPFPISKVFDFTPAGTTPVSATPHFIFPGQQVQALAGLSTQLRDILEGRGTIDTLEGLKSIDMIPISLRGSNGLMTRQLWRLQDLRDGGGLGFTIELFFLSFRSTSPSQVPDNVFYAETFRKITSRWMETRESLGTQKILLNIVCDLVIQSRGMFSDFSYPKYITNMLLEMVGNILRGNSGPGSHIDDAMQEIGSANSINCIGFRDRAWNILEQTRSNRNS
ncbi:hypothetical protein EDB87DRAFT_819810 [Lactarius vividus]|nr:hypothetical protein EDB87DRAFT_819810 [Lactarius vividus]